MNTRERDSIMAVIAEIENCQHLLKTSTVSYVRGRLQHCIDELHMILQQTKTPETK